MTEVSTLLRSMAGNSWKKLTGASQGSFTSALLPRTRANFDALDTWASDAAVQNTPMSGLAPLSLGSVFAYTAPEISDDGLVIVTGGGHADGGDSSGYYFDIEAAAASINASGAGGTWALSWKSARYLDANKHSRPAWSLQPDVTTPTGNNQSYWADLSADGVQMWSACHAYWMPRFLPGTRTLCYSGEFMFNGNGQGGPGGCFVVDLANPAVPSVTGPFKAPSYPTEAGDGGAKGFAITGPRSNFDGLGPVANDDGTLWVLSSTAFNSRIYKWENPANPATVACTKPNSFSGNIEPQPFRDLLMFPDPTATGDPNKRAIFQSRRNANNGQFLLIKDATGTPAEVAGVYAASVVPRQSNISYAWDGSRGRIVVSDCADLYQVVVNSDPATWAIEKITAGATGDVPNVSTSLSFPRLKYLAAEDAYVVADYGDVWLYKPSDWVDPEGGGSPIPAIIQHYRRRRAA